MKTKNKNLREEILRIGITMATYVLLMYLTNKIAKLYFPSNMMEVDHTNSIIGKVITVLVPIPFTVLMYFAIETLQSKINSRKFNEDLYTEFEETPKGWGYGNEENELEFQEELESQEELQNFGYSNNRDEEETYLEDLTEVVGTNKDVGELREQYLGSNDQKIYQESFELDYEGSGDIEEVEVERIEEMDEIEYAEMKRNKQAERMRNVIATNPKRKSKLEEKIREKEDLQAKEILEGVLRNDGQEEEMKEAELSDKEVAYLLGQTLIEKDNFGYNFGYSEGEFKGKEFEDNKEVNTESSEIGEVGREEKEELFNGLLDEPTKIDTDSVTKEDAIKKYLEDLEGEQELKMDKTEEQQRIEEQREEQRIGEQRIEEQREEQRIEEQRIEEQRIEEAEGGGDALTELNKMLKGL